MALVAFPVDQVTWSRPPSTFASSNRAERGFCADCGTPLTYQVIGGTKVELTIFSFDDPSAITPDVQCEKNRRPNWCLTLGDLPDNVPDDPNAPPVVSYQHPDCA